MRKSIVERIESEVVDLMTHLRAPTVALLGKKEYRELNKNFAVKEKDVKIKTGETTVAQLHLNACANAIEIVPTTHKTYFRVV